MSAERLPREKDMIRTDDGLYFTVFAYRHPPDGYVAYLQYMPGQAGDPRRARVKPMHGPHVGGVARTIDWLARGCPHYVRPDRGHPLPVVPADRVARYYRPEERLAELLRDPRDELERLIARFAGVLAGAAGVTAESLGVTGSVLVDLHDPAASDIDLVVYGAAAARRLRDALQTGRVPGAGPEAGAALDKRLREIRERFALGEAEAEYCARRTWFRGLYRGREFSVRPVRTDAEIRAGADGCPAEGDWRPGGAMRIWARIAGADQALFMPAVYTLADVRILEGLPLPPARLVAFEGLYTDIFAPGQEIEALGKLELRDDGDRRLVVGTLELAGREFIRVQSALAAR